MWYNKGWGEKPWETQLPKGQVEEDLYINWMSMNLWMSDLMFLVHWDPLSYYIRSTSLCMLMPIDRSSLSLMSYEDLHLLVQVPMGKQQSQDGLLERHSVQQARCSKAWPSKCCIFNTSSSNWTYSKGWQGEPMLCSDPPQLWKVIFVNFLLPCFIVTFY